MFKLIALGVLAVSLSHEAMALNDPTRPLNFSAKKSEQVYRLQSVFIGQGRKTALINGQNLQEQQTITNSGGAVVVSIQPYQVVLQKGDKRWTLKLRQQAVVRK